jgi:hypothetical protein
MCVSSCVFFYRGWGSAGTAFGMAADMLALVYVVWWNKLSIRFEANLGKSPFILPIPLKIFVIYWIVMIGKDINRIFFVFLDVSDYSNLGDIAIYMVLIPAAVTGVVSLFYFYYLYFTLPRSPRFNEIKT